MYLSLLFWIALGLPGYALLRRWANDETHSGLLGTIAVSYLATFALLSPFSIAAYVFCLPTWFFAAACLIAILAGVIELTRQKCWPEAGRMLVAAVGIEMLIVLADLFLGAWNGAFLGGDAKVHVARIRFLVDNGFSNLDPYVTSPCFFPIYHTNILHAIYAACAKLTGTDPADVWFASLAWGKLLTVSGAYYLAWRVFGQRLPAWAAAMFCIGARGPIHFAIYPNQLAPFWLMPVMIGVVVRCWSGRLNRSCVLMLASGSLVLGQMHGMYVLFIGALVGPVLAGRLLWSLARRRPDLAAAVGAVLALAAGLPFVFVSHRGNVAKAPIDPTAAARSADDLESATVAVGESWIIREPRATLHAFGGPIGLCVFLGAVIIAFSTQRRVESTAMTAIMLTGAAMLFIPPLATALVRRGGEPWILARLEVIFAIGFTCLAAPALASKAEPYLRGRHLRSALMVLACPAGALWATQPEPLTWTRWLAGAARPATERQAYLLELRRIRDFLDEHVQPGQTILTDPQTGMDLVQAYDCHVVASVSASNGVPDMQERFGDLDLMLSADLAWPRRRELLQKYGIEYYFPVRSPIEWTVGHVSEHWLDRPFVLARLRVNE